MLLVCRHSALRLQDNFLTPPAAAVHDSRGLANSVSSKRCEKVRLEISEPEAEENLCNAQTPCASESRKSAEVELSSEDGHLRERLKLWLGGDAISCFSDHETFKTS